MYSGFVEVRRRDKQGFRLRLAVRIWLYRLYALLTVCMAILTCTQIADNGKYAVVLFGVSVYWGMRLFLSLLSGWWCCERCGRRMGPGILLVNRCPHCGR